jgi:hypothetical protein
MFATLVSTRRTLDDLAREFDAPALSPEAALRFVDELGAVRRVVDGMLAKAAKRAIESDRYAGIGAASVARTLGVATGEVRAAIETATKLEALPATDSAVRAGRLSAREAQMIVDAAAANPAAEADLLATATRGLVPLRDACVAARAAIEDPADRRRRHQKLREWHSWTDPDGMLAGRYRFAPEVGGLLKTRIDAHVQRVLRAHKAGAEHEPLAAYAADVVAAFILGNAIEATDDATNLADAPTAVLDLSATGVDATVHILIDHAVLMGGGTVDGDVCEIPGVGPVDVAWVRELLGSAFLTVVIKKGKDILTVAHLGRHVPAEVQTALLVRGRECDVDGCNSRGYLERDHVHDHARGGPTAFSNLGWLCYAHHRLKSAGWRLGPPDPATRKRKLRPPPVRAG